ncbi:MAG: DUF2007 domain-containing protein [Planctomycetes bacterium]|nr:DUF2007 domain-containing protein [Planctomycetota bacterium]
MSKVKVYTGRHSLDAHHVCSVLETEGIEVTVIGDLLEGVCPVVPPTAENLPSLWVDSSVADRALALVRRFVPNAPSSAGETA